MPRYRPDIRAQLTGSFTNAERRFIVLPWRRAELGSLTMAKVVPCDLSAGTKKRRDQPNKGHTGGTSALAKLNHRNQETGLATPGPST
jgi:hypothetical protein